MLETRQYVRKPFYIDAVQVTPANLSNIARWSGGEVRTESDGSQYVKVRVQRPLNDRQTKAYVGDWVLFAGTGYKVYTPKAFANSFEQASVETKLHPLPDVVETVVEQEHKVEKAVKKAKKPVPAPPVVTEAVSE